jgi:6-pyruvoyl-tetrahydropterin synthase related domain
MFSQPIPGLAVHPFFAMRYARWRHSVASVVGHALPWRELTPNVSPGDEASSAMPQAADWAGRPRLWPGPLLIIMLVAAAVVGPFLFRGNPSGHDFEFHLNSWIEVTQQWKEGVIYPRWAGLANYGYGEPRFIFYPPLSWMLGAALGLALPWKVVPGAYIGLALILAGCSMFFLARRWLNRRDAVFAAAVYVSNPYHLLIVYWRSAFGELLVACVLPLLLLFLLRLSDEPQANMPEPVTALALLVATAWLADAPAGVMVNYSFILLLTVLALMRRSLAIFARGVAALAAGLALGAFYLLPAAYERKWVDIFQAFAGDARPRENFLFSQTHHLFQHQFNMIITLVAMTEILLLFLSALQWKRWSRQFPRAGWMLAAWAGISASLLFSFSGFVWNTLPDLRYMQFPWRWLLCLNVPVALLITIAWRRWTVRAGMAAILLATVLFSGYRLMPPWWDTAGDVAELQDNIESGPGYEGTEEYLPATADVEKIDHEARRVTYEGSGTDQIHVFKWGPENKVFSVASSAPGTLVLHLFHYPAWQVTVNGRPAGSETRSMTGQIAIPIQSGENQIVLTFVRTWDRTIGGWISLVSLTILAGWVISQRRRRGSIRSA